jgi:hypothetical protein
MKSFLLNNPFGFDTADDKAVSLLNQHYYLFLKKTVPERR